MPQVSQQGATEPGARILDSAWLRASSFMLAPARSAVGPGGVGGMLGCARNPPGPAYLKKYLGSQPAPGWGAAPRGGFSPQRTPEASTEGSSCWGYYSNLPQRRCWTHCCSWDGAESPRMGRLPCGVRCRPVGSRKDASLPVLAQERGNGEESSSNASRGLSIRLKEELTVKRNF